MEADAVVALTTLPSPDAAAALGRALVEEGLVACATLVPGVRSIYRWHGQLCDDVETLLVLKTRASLVARLTHRIPSLHPYDVPELIVLPIVDGAEPYLRWLRAGTI